MNEQKVRESISYLLKKAGGEMPYIKLIKLLYLADRRKIQTKGRPISGDAYFSIKCGPILSGTLDAIKHQGPDWSDIIEADLEAKIVWQVAEAPPSRLSKADIEVLNWVSEHFGHWPWKKLVRYTHRLGEWQEPTEESKSSPITLQDIGKALRLGDDQISRIVANQEEIESLEPFMESLRPSA